ncbi:DUF1259 domain-containing protein [soil metagenome]
MQRFVSFLIAAAVALPAPVSAALAQETGGGLRAAVSRAAGTDATQTDDGAARIGWTRDDVAVTVDGMRLKPSAGLGSWAAFKPAGNATMVMGDTVVFEDEITPAIDAALDNGLTVTALHNHFIFDDPPVFFLHIGGYGDAADLAAGVEAVWDAIKAVRAESPTPRLSFGGQTPDSDSVIDCAPLEDILEAGPSINDGVVKFTFPRQGMIHGDEIGGSMGLSTWAAFSGSDESAAVDGDFIMAEIEVQPVLRALRAHGIHVVALHNHMIGGEPVFYFLHYWGTGPASELAAGVQAAREAQDLVQ